MSVCRNPCCQPANSTELSIYCKLLEVCRRPTFWLQKVTVYMNEVLAHKGLHTLLTCGLKISAKEKKKKGTGWVEKVGRRTVWATVHWNVGFRLQ